MKQLLDVVAARARRTIQEILDGLPHVFVGEGAGGKGNAFAFARRRSDRIAELRKNDLPGATQREQLARELRELGRIDRRKVASVVAGDLRSGLEQRQIVWRLEPCQQRLELEFAIEAIEFVAGRRAITALFPIDAQRQIAANDRDGSAEAGLLPVLFDQTLQLRIARKGRIRYQRVERAGCLQKFARGLFANAGNSGKVVRRIPFEPAVIGQLRGFEPEAFANGERIVASQLGDAALGHQDGDPVVNDLQ